MTKRSVRVADDKKIMQIRISKDLYDKAQAKASKSGLTISDVVRNRLNEYVSDPNGVLIFR